MTLTSTNDSADLRSGFQDIASHLRTTDVDSLCTPAIPITYNPKSETITLTGPKSEIERAKTKLQGLLDISSNQWGEKYLVSSHADMEYESLRSRYRPLESQCSSCNTDSERVRVFPIVPKNHPLLVSIWFRCLLPALPDILRPILGGNYTASLIRRGRSRLLAPPCIQIESPYPTGLATQDIIKESLNHICEKEHHPAISVRFVQGTVRKLSSGEEDDINTTVEDADSQRLRFNLSRPCSKPVMGDSVGLLCSKKVSATIGGFVLVDSDKYMLTSDHFVTTSQEPVNRDGDHVDLEILETLISPSRYDLNDMESCLKQSLRDLDSQINSLMPKIHGDQEIPADCLSTHSFLAAELCEMLARKRDITCLLNQVTKPTLEYAVGTVFRRSLEERTASIPKDLADLLSVETPELKYHMDWSLCKLKNQTGENRHKYRSTQDAKKDDYIDEADRGSQPGEVCHKTCDAESGIAVFYVGQGSQHRNGMVNLPMLVSTNSCITHGWAIMDPEGESIKYSHVAGDSGAWVIRRSNNELMGQVYAWGNTGQVLFTPIKVIFDDLEQLCETDITLPPGLPDPGQPASETIPLCAVQNTPPLRPYGFLSSSLAVHSRPKVPYLNISPPGALPGDKLCEKASTCCIDTSHGLKSPSPLRDSPTCLPGLTDSLRTKETLQGSPYPHRIPEGGTFAGNQVSNETTPSGLLPPIGSIIDESSIPTLSLDEPVADHTVKAVSHQTQFRTRILLREIPGIRTTTWPIDGNRVNLKARFRMPSRHPARTHPTSASTTSICRGFIRLARQKGMSTSTPTPDFRPFDADKVIEIESILGPSARNIGRVPRVEDVSRQNFSPIIPRCNVAA